MKRRTGSATTSGGSATLENSRDTIRPGNFATVCEKFWKKFIAHSVSARLLRFSSSADSQLFHHVGLRVKDRTTIATFTIADSTESCFPSLLFMGLLSQQSDPAQESSPRKESDHPRCGPRSVIEDCNRVCNPQTHSFEPYADKTRD